MKHCNYCDQDKPLKDFNKRGSILQPNCRECQSLRHRSYYQDVQSARRSQIRARAAKKKLLAKAYISEFFSTNHCSDCGNSDKRVLDFDHVRGEKFANVSSLVGQGYPLEAIKIEIDKCEVRCANCHRIVTYERRHSPLV